MTHSFVCESIIRFKSTLMAFKKCYLVYDENCIKVI